MAIADKLAVMREGTIQQVGTPEQVYSHPANEFAADFIKYYDYAYHLRALKKWTSCVVVTYFLQDREPLILKRLVLILVQPVLHHRII